MMKNEVIFENKITKMKLKYCIIFIKMNMAKSMRTIINERPKLDRDC